jgi:hypothetical protein
VPVIALNESHDQCDYSLNIGKIYEINKYLNGSLSDKNMGFQSTCAIHQKYVGLSYDMWQTLQKILLIPPGRGLIVISFKYSFIRAMFINDCQRSGIISI